MKISVSPRREHAFKGFEELKINQKIDRKSMQNKAGKNYENNFENISFEVVLERVLGGLLELGRV